MWLNVQEDIPVWVGAALMTFKVGSNSEVSMTSVNLTCHLSFFFLNRKTKTDLNLFNVTVWFTIKIDKTRSGKLF